MQKHIQGAVIFFLIVVTTLLSCSKESMDLFSNPASDGQASVALLRVDSTGEETAMAYAKITDKGKGEVEHVGFCFSTKNKLPTLYDQQILMDGTDGAFEHAFSGLIADTTYYIRAFALNKYGTSYSNVIAVRIGLPKPVTPTCQLVSGKVSPGTGFTYNVISVYSGTGVNLYHQGYGFYASWGSGSLHFSFNKEPLSGVYKTVEDYENLPYEKKGVWVYYRFGFGELANMYSDSSVYVSKNANGSVDVTFCGLTYKPDPFGSLVLTGKGRFLVP